MRGVELTKCGLLLKERGRAILDDIRQSVNDIKEESDPTKGEVSVGTSEPLAVITSEIVTRLAEKYPRIRFHVTVADASTLLRLLRERALDLLLTRTFSADNTDDLLFETLFRSQLAVMAGQHHPVVRRKKVTLVSLSDEQWVVPPSTSEFGRMVTDIFWRLKLALPQAVVTTVSMSMRLNLLAGGRFISILPVNMLRHPSTTDWLRALDVDLGDTTGPIVSITLKRRRASGTVKLFQEASRVVCRKYASEHG